MGSPEDWRKVAVHLPAERHWIALQIPEADLDFDETCAAIAGEMSRRSALPVHLVGYSLGARLALSIVLRHPTWIARATLVGVNPGLEDADERAARATSDEAWARLLETQSLPEFLDQWGAQPVLAMKSPVPESERQADRRRREGKDRVALARMIRRLSLARMASTWSELATIECPTDLVVGAADEKFLQIAERMRKHLPTARLYRVADSGHNVLLERPRELSAIIADGSD